MQMTTHRLRGCFVSSAFASLLLCAVLAGCGGGAAPVSSGSPPLAIPLPVSVSVTGPSRAETAQAVRWQSSLGPLQSGWSVEWDFGDGGRSAVAEPSHAYLRGGDYTVTLTVRNDVGESRVARSGLQVGAYNRVQGSDCSGDGFSGWCWQLPQAAAFDLLDAQLVDANTAWAVGPMNRILNTRDGGANWQAQRPPTPPPLDSSFNTPGPGRLEQVRFFDAQAGVVTSSFPGSVLRTEDSGLTWQALVLPPMWWIRKVWLLDRQTIVLSGFELSSRFGYGLKEADKTLISQDGGKNWRVSVLVVSEITAGPTLWSAIPPLVSGSQVSRDLGRTAESTSPCCVRSLLTLPRPTRLGDVDLLMRSQDTSDFAMLSRPEVIHRSADRGLSWQSATVQPPTEGQRLMALNYRSATDAWATFDSTTTNAQGLTQRRWQRASSSDGGSRWMPVAAPVEAATTYAAVFRFDLTGWAVVSDSQQAQTFDDVDPGSRTLTLPENGRFLRSVSRQRGTLLAGFGSSAADRWYLSNDSGARWALLPGGRPGESQVAIAGLWFTDSNQGLATSADGSLLSTTNGGRNWLRTQVAPRLPTASLQFTADATGWGLIDQTLWRSNDRGRSWQQQSSPPGRPIDLKFLDARRGWMVIEQCPTAGDVSACVTALFGTSDGAVTWLPFSAPEQVNAVHFAGESNGISIANSRIWVTSDGGRSWAESLTPTLSTNPWKVRFVDSQNGWMLFAGTAGPQGGVSAVVRRTRDGGRTWSATGALPRGNSVPVDLAFADELRGWVVGTSGLLLATQDGGDTWSVQISGTDRDLNAVVAVDAVTVWAAGQRGTVLTTSTGGR